MTRRRKFWGWGLEGEGLSTAERDELLVSLRRRYPAADLVEPGPSPSVDEIELRPPRIQAPPALADRFRDDPYERLLHSYGKSLPDSIRAFRRSYPEPPDLVAYPESEQELGQILDWASDANVAVIAFGGGSSVCGGVEPVVGDDYEGTVTVDLAELGAVLEIDEQSLAARIQAGATGPALEAALRERGLTLRHFPQSFEHSTLGGWIATRSGGHFATLYTHIDDLVESLRVLTPAGAIESRRLPGSGAGPSPDRLFLGSEGTLGFITEAWMRVRRRPDRRASAAVTFDDFPSGAAAVRALSQSSLFPTNCRLIDGDEAGSAGAADGRPLLVLGFEAEGRALGAWLDQALELTRDHGGRVEVADRGDGDGGTGEAHRGGPAGAWRRSFLKAPYYREALTPMGVLADTFETSITWDRFDALHRGVLERMSRVLREVTGHEGSITCRFTHVYPDGPAPYFSFRVPTPLGAMLEHWREIKAVANEVVVGLGGTITHHHAVGRDHRPGYEHQRPELFEAALRSAKRALDPAGILNPGVLFDPCDRPVGVTGAMKS